MRRCHVGVAENGGFLQLLDGGLVLGGGGHGVDAHGDDGQTPGCTPLAGQNFVHGLGQLHGVARQGGIPDAQSGDAGERRLQSGEELGFQLAVQLVAGVVLRYVAADVLVEQHGVGNLIGIFTVAADGNVHIQTDVVVHNTEGDGSGGAVLVANQFLQVEEVHPLILGGVSAEGEAALEGFPAAFQTFQTALKNGGFAGGIPGVFAGLGGELHNLALLHDHHALPLVDGDDGAVGNDVVRALGVAAAGGGTLFALGDQNVGRHAVTVEILFPLIGKDVAHRSQCCFDQTHNAFSLCKKFFDIKTFRRRRRGCFRWRTYGRSCRHRRSCCFPVGCGFW